jgi:hypothetical protein
MLCFHHIFVDGIL